VSCGYASYEERVARFRLDDVLAEAFGDAGAGLDACVLCYDRYCGSGKVALRWISARGELMAYSFDDVRLMSIRGAHRLTRAGVKKGDAVAGLLPRIPELVAIILATWRIGAVYQPLFTAFRPKAIEHRFATARTRFVVTNSANRGKLAEISNCPAIATLVAEGGTLSEGDTDLRAALGDGLDSFELAHLLGTGNALIWELAPISKQTAELRKDKIADLRHAFETALNIAVEEVRKAKPKA
jgi:acetyl-CoA synthetase